MKQRISHDQLYELNPNERVQLWDWWVDNCVDHPDTVVAGHLYRPLLSNGQMIQLLSDMFTVFIHTGMRTSEVHIIKKDARFPIRTEVFVESELCDALWQAVKHVLKVSETQ